MKPPIFIVGTPRSGTTLTAKLLNNHSNIFIPGETHYFDDIYSRRNELGMQITPINSYEIFKRLSNIYERYNESVDQKRVDQLFELPSAYDSFLSSCQNYADVFSWFMELQMQHVRKVRWGNQVPRDLFNVNEILNHYPEAKFIVCIRDNRDFLVSYKNKWKKAEDINNRKRLMKLYHPVVTSLLWKSSMNNVQKLNNLVPDRNRILVKYEQLASSPGNTLRNICNCIDESYEEGMQSIHFNNSSFSNSQAGIFTTSISRWKSELTSEEVAVAQWVCRKEMKRFGYKASGVNSRCIRQCWILATTPIAFLGGVNANKSLRGSTLKYFLKRLGPFFK